MQGDHQLNKQKGQNKRSKNPSSCAKSIPSHICLSRNHKALPLFMDNIPGEVVCVVTDLI